MTSTQLFVPAAVVPMSAQVRGIVGHHHEMKGSRRDGEIATGTQVVLHRLVGLDRGHGGLFYPNRAHAITARVAATARTTITMSRTERSCSRKGLNPTSRR